MTRIYISFLFVNLRGIIFISETNDDPIGVLIWRLLRKFSLVHSDDNIGAFVKTFRYQRVAFFVSSYRSNLDCMHYL